MKKDLLSVTDAAIELRIHPFSLRRLEERGELVPLCRIGGRRVYTREAVERFKAARSAKRR